MKTMFIKASKVYTGKTRFGQQTQTATAGLYAFGFGYGQKQTRKAVVSHTLKVVLSAIGIAYRQKNGRSEVGEVGSFFS